MQVAHRVVEEAIGEHLDGSPLPEPEPDTRNPYAVGLSTLGASKGGKARAKALSPAKRKAIAKKAAASRWYFMYCNFGRVHQTLVSRQRWKLA